MLQRIRYGMVGGGEGAFIGARIALGELGTVRKEFLEYLQGWLAAPIETQGHKQAAQSQTYCDEIKGRLAQHGVQITELATHLQGQLMAVHPSYGDMFKPFAGPVRDNPAARQAWSTEQLTWAARAGPLRRRRHWLR